VRGVGGCGGERQGGGAGPGQWWRCGRRGESPGGWWLPPGILPALT
jgi:hypothetical protein